MLPDDPQRFQSFIGEFRFDRLFNELGWDRAGARPHTLQIGSETFTLTAVAQKRGVTLFRCSPDAAGEIPLRPTLLRIEQEAAKLAHEHLLIFTDAAQTRQTWLWVARAPGLPAATRTHHWRKGASGEALRQKLAHIAFSLDEEEALTLTGVTVRLRDAFDRDRVTRKFFEQFSKEQQHFAGFIQGLDDGARRGWYASLMLNRLMFVYFIQRKGFLDGNVNYLTDRLRRVRADLGQGEFHSFYRRFLCKLFHEGLGQPKGARRPELEALLGDVPYLNGGLFALHELEEANPAIDIPDEAFERLFRFFDAYDWHLDDRPLAAGNEINPDVLGYIFEKYINQKQMGAYYTKEDITEYIAKNTVLPFLLERARERCKVAFEGEASVWALLRDRPDRYLYPALKRGVIDAHGDLVAESLLPDFVQAGMKDPKARMFDRRYNLGEASFVTAAGEAGGLPTETWREYVERRNRCLELRGKMQRGEIAVVDDLITSNLDIRQFVQDVIDTCSGPELLRAIWQAIIGRSPEKSHERFRHGIAILDPTCGSGAFLFAALNILEPLYEACLERMEGFVQDAERLSSPVKTIAHPDFRRALDEVAKHPSRRYYIYRSIILHNLFGVDLMPEAVEICKLRLFLKLVAQVDAGAQLEPLPDIDFNIRAGNTLVGFATVGQFDASANLGSDLALRDEIKADIADFGEALDRFREQQDVHGGQITAEDKRVLRERREQLAAKLDHYLAREYGKDPDKPGEFAEWRASHQPFHWFAEFAGIMAEGGFDVVIGNPPYIQLKEINEYQLKGYDCIECGNIYPIILERCLSIINSKGKQGYIVPVSSISTDGYQAIQEKFNNYRVHVSCYDDRPSRLFDGLEHIRLVIFLISKTGDFGWHSTRYNKWNSAERITLFERLSYISVKSIIIRNSIPKLTSLLEISILEKLNLPSQTIGAATVKFSHYVINFSRKVGYFLQVVDFQPRVVDGKGKLRPPSEFKTLNFSALPQKNSALAVLNSNLFYWFITVFSDCRHLNKREIEAMTFPVELFKNEQLSVQLERLSKELMYNLRATSEKRNMRFKHDHLEIESLIPKLSKNFIDQIDEIIALGFSFTDEETDFIINYDIKYRMGGVDEEGE